MAATRSFLPEIQEEGMPKLLTLADVAKFQEIAREHEFVAKSWRMRLIP